MHTLEKLKNDELRGYFFGNMYLSSIQQGIQAAHVIKDMVVKYKFMSSIASPILSSWMEHHKTMILLNGGYQSNLQRIYDELRELTHNGSLYPIGTFHEEEDALNGALTCVGIVVPHRVHSLDERSIEWGVSYNEQDAHIARILKSCKLAI